MDAVGVYNDAGLARAIGSRMVISFVVTKKKEVEYTTHIKQRMSDTRSIYQYYLAWPFSFEVSPCHVGSTDYIL